MKSWIVTGGAACGKSVFIQALESQRGSALCSFSCDREVGKLMADRQIQALLLQAFGTQIFDSDGVICKKWLRELIFKDVDKRRELEAILHPPVMQSLERSRLEAKAQGAEVFLAEVPLYYEIGSTVEADLIIVVAASQAMQIRRLMEIRGLDQDIAHGLLGSQWTIEAKIEKADVVIWNDGDLRAFLDQALTLGKQIRPA
jgi:dephospho-CoA kinase